MQCGNRRAWQQQSLPDEIILSLLNPLPRLKTLTTRYLTPAPPISLLSRATLPLEMRFEMPSNHFSPTPLHADADPGEGHGRAPPTRRQPPAGGGMADSLPFPQPGVKPFTAGLLVPAPRVTPLRCPRRSRRCPRRDRAARPRQPPAGGRALSAVLSAPRTAARLLLPGGGSRRVFRGSGEGTCPGWLGSAAARRRGFSPGENGRVCARAGVRPSGQAAGALSGVGRG